jgi:AhpD family alkylhydroperoxidase
MARLPYAEPVSDEAAIVAQHVVEQRGELLHLYRMLLHSPPVCQGWLTYLTAVRQQCELPGAIREMVIMRIAHLNGAPYEAEQHAPLARAEGMSDAQIEALNDWQGSSLFDARQRAVLSYCDAMTRNVQVSDDAFATVREFFDERGVVELTATIAAYSMVSRFLEALNIHSTDCISVGNINV